MILVWSAQVISRGIGLHRDTHFEPVYQLENVQRGDDRSSRP
jgi:hypothetical protein